MSEGLEEVKPVEKAVREARAEYGRLRLKRKESTDKDVQSALDMRLKQLEDEFGDSLKLNAVIPSAPKLTFSEDLTPPDPKILRETDMLLARANHSRLKGDKSLAERLVKEAFEKAPNSVAVLEVMGDDYLEKRMFDYAKETFARAKLLDPKNANIERKFGTAVLRKFNAGSLDDQMRNGLSDGILLNSEDQVAGSASAVFLSAFLPGLGHLILGRSATGLSIMAGWIVCSIWFLFRYKDFVGLIQAALGKGGSIEMGVLVPLFLMVCIWIATLKSLTGSPKSDSRKKIDHPRPPVDLPFE